ncbi:MAG TPA: MG2 domain-containing protein [Dissulfurispiraceae bacterium]|nr:MG2 domain-containing protein [Dissulfurispiraceae bacterium]
MLRIACLIGIFLLLFSLTPSSPFAADTARVEQFTPSGTVKDVRQVTARFSAPMVPFGDPRLPDPFIISCPVGGAGRWADTRIWVYDFAQNLPAGMNCSFTLKEGLKILSGAAVVEPRVFAFSTGGPSVRSMRPYEGNVVEEDQIFVALLDAVPDTESILRNVFFSVKGINEKIGVRIIDGAVRKTVLTATGLISKKSPEPTVPVVVLQAAQRFPADAVLNLVWGKGVATTSGGVTVTDQVVPFRVRKAFTAQFSCTREKKGSGCIPMLPMEIRFSAPVARASAENTKLRSAGNKVFPSLLSGDDNEDEESSAERTGEKQKPQFVSFIQFKGPFPEKTAFTLSLPKDMKDETGRPLVNAERFPLTVKTEGFPPLAKFNARFGIVELKGGAALPVTVRNLEPAAKTRINTVADDASAGASTASGQTLKGKLERIDPEKESKIIGWLRTIRAVGRQHSVFAHQTGIREFVLPRPAGPNSFEVIGIPLPEPGFYVVEIESNALGASLLGKQKPMYVPTAALVTNMSAHLKWGRQTSLVWVTTLDSGSPVEGADVTVRDCTGKLVWGGVTDKAGIAMIKKELPSQQILTRCNSQKSDDDSYYDEPQMEALQDISGGLFVFAKKGNDLTFVHSAWNRGIEPWRFNLPSAAPQKQLLAHTVFDRTLMRAGETVHMKHIVRRHGIAGISAADAASLPKTVSIRHSGSDQKYEFPLLWNAGGSAETTWVLPKDAALGTYNVVLLDRDIKKSAARVKIGEEQDGGEEDWKTPRWNSGSFRVEEFRVPLMRGSIQPPKEPAVHAVSLDLDLLVTYLSGGGAGNETAQLRTATEYRSVSFDDYDDFTFANGAVKTGITSHGTAPDSGGHEDEQATAAETPGAPKTVQVVLDSAGAARAKVADLPKLSTPQNLVAELEFRDPNGEVQTVSRRIPLWPARLIVGIKPESWAASKDAFTFHIVALDLNGKAVAGTQISVDLFQRTTYSHRKRLIGGFYAYEHTTETKRVGPLCSGLTDSRGLLICDVKSPVSGNVILQATAKDGDGNLAAAHRDVWIAANDEWWFDVSDNDRIDLLPEKKRYESGQTARLQLRMPFREATALVTVEREGVIDTFVRKVSGKSPIIEVPVKPNYAPNVFISALIVRGRIDDVKPTAFVDLGRPAYKLGIAEVKVGWKPHELKVSVQAERQLYKVREKANVRITVRTAGGKIPPKGSEVALAAVDEGLLELMPNRSWNLLEAMMGRRAFEVTTATAQTQVIGKRHFGLKALPHGGGGGSQATRELFDTLLLWKGRVALNAKGEAQVAIPLNDSITSFRIVAVATSGAGLFGTGHTGIRTSQDLILLSGLPQMVREGDQFRAQFTVRNTTNRQMAVDLSALVTPGAVLPSISESLAPGQAKTVGWEMTVPLNSEMLTWEITAREKGTDAADRLKVAQRVRTAVPVRIFQATITQVAGTISTDVEKPKDALGGKGGVSVTLQPRLAESLSGVKWYMQNYPYTCMEQKVSRAVALRDAALWKHAAAEMPAHLDGDGLLKYFPPVRWGDPTLTAYVYAIAHEAGWELPAAVSERMESGLSDFVQGKIVRTGTLPTADLTIRKLLAIEALSRSGKATPSMINTITVDPNLWPTSTVLDWKNILSRVTGIPNRGQRIKEADQIIRSRLNFQGTTMGFSTERADSLWWLMISTDQNAVRTLLTYLQDDAWRDDMPRLVRGALGRQQRGAWNTTTANAWGVLAMEKFSQKFEETPVAGSTQVRMNSQTARHDWSSAPRSATFDLHWPKQKETLSINHQGDGKPWATLRSLAAIPLKEPLSSGYRIRKTLTALQQKAAGVWSSGDVVRVKLDIEAQSDMTWVVVSDPIPAGATILGSGLGRDSSLLTKNEKSAGWAWPVFQERSFEAFRAYYDYVAKGKWSLEYTVRLNNEGVFNLPPTRVEAMYAPEMFGEIPSARFEVTP